MPVKRSKGKGKLKHFFAALAGPALLYAGQYAAVFGAMILMTIWAIVTGVGEAEAEEYVYTMLESHMNEVLIVADLLILAILLLWFAICRKKSDEALSMNNVKLYIPLLGIVAGMGLNCALNYVMTLAYEFFPKVMQEYEEHMGTDDLGSPSAYVIAGIIMAPIIEELLFRSIALKNLDKVIPRWLSIVLVAALFGFVHGNLVQGLYAGTLGILLCALFFAYDSVWVPMAVHFGFNFVSIFALFDVESMTELQADIFNFIYMIFFQGALWGGIVAFVLLIVLHTHPTWRKKPKAGKIILHQPIL